MYPLTDIEKKFIDAIRAAVKENGEDYIYPDHLRNENYESGSCQYTVGGVGACIVGKAIQIAAGEPYEGPNHNSLDVLVQYGLSFALRDAFASAQREQDRNETWGAALAVFETRLVHHGIHHSTVDNSPESV